MLFSPVPAELLDARNEIGRRPRPPRPPESDRDRAIVAEVRGGMPLAVVAASTVAAIDAALTRHQRRWMPSPEGEAA